MEPPRRLLDLPPPGSLVVEVGVGGLDEVWAAWRRERRDVRLLVVDLTVDRLGAGPTTPAGREGQVAWATMDAAHPALDLAQVALVYAVRPPEELQAALLRWPCPVAVRPLGGELVAGPWRPVGNGWSLRERPPGAPQH